jgi:UDP-MurNAc hydroxylase
MKDQIKLINHSSVLISNDTFKLLTDPWYTGSAFNNGWSLLYENDIDTINKILSNLNYIFISHEHPDHFSINFFKDYEKIIKLNNIKIIFQSTQDKRVEKFLKSMNFEMIILDHKDKYKINDETSLTIFKQGHIDSALLCETEEFYHLNLNDCNFLKRELLEINNYMKNKNKKIIIYIQFSYASFRANDEWLKQAALYKLNNIVNVNNIFNSSLIIPFASFFNFSHSENQHLTKFVNTSSTVTSFLDKNKINHCFLSPRMDLIDLSILIEKNLIRIKINTESVNFWDDKKINAKVNFYEIDPVPVDEKNIQIFLSRIKKYNNLYLMFLIRLLSLKKIFGDLIIKINKKNYVYLLNFFEVSKLDNLNIKPDISISSEQFNLFLKQPYGIESMLVSGRLRAINKNGLKKLTSAIGVTTINLSNYGINFKDIFNKLIFNKIIGLIHRAITQKS